MTSIDPSEHWRRVSDLFDWAIDLDPRSRRDLLDRECADDAALRAELESMLAADAHDAALDVGAIGFVDADLLDATQAGRDDEPARDIGSLLGNWRLERVLGRGGMGTVYAAQRDADDTRQRAAVKRLHRRWDGGPHARRFLQERRILAALSHPFLPGLIDHGLDDDGRPWFALEFVDGPDLVAWADAQRLDLRARIRLLRDVCSAVQHAHERFVVHRDLKPANILVDRDGHPKVLDFGVAKRMDDAAGATHTGLFAGFTPEYAAPEQIAGGVISAATDVHALGVILFQLLAGQLPYRFEHANLRDAAEAITTRTAERMDRALTTGTPDEVDARVAQRGTTTSAFRRFVRGDLTRIVQTALAKEPERRYASVQALSTDLQRFLEGRTVSVVGDTAGYRARKFVRRNRWAVAIGGIAAIAICAALGTALWQARLARERARTTEAVKTFVTGLLSSPAPEVSLGAPLTVREVLDRGRAQLGADRIDDPNVAVELLTVMGRSYAAIERRDEARALFDRAARIAPRADPDHRADLADAALELALKAGDMPAARHEGATLQALLPEVDDPRAHVSYLLSLADLEGFEGRMEASRARIDAGLQLARTRLPPDDPQRIAALQSLAILEQLQGKPVASVAPLEEALARAERSLPRAHPTQVQLRGNLATAYIAQARFVEGARLLQEAVVDTRTLYGRDSLAAAEALVALCRGRMSGGDYRDARAPCTEALAIFREARTADGLGIAKSELALASIENVAGHRDAALALQTDAIARTIAATGAAEPSVAFLQLMRARTLTELDRDADARATIDAVLATAGPDGAARGLAWVYRGNLERRAGRTDDALALHRRAVDHFARIRTQRYNYVLRAKLELARDQLLLGRREEGMTGLQDVVAGLAVHMPYESPELGDAWCALGTLQHAATESRADTLRGDGGQRLLRQCIAFRDHVFGVADRETARYRALVDGIGATDRAAESSLR